MSVYKDGADTIRDATKWLAALIPLGSIATVVVLAGPQLVRSTQSVSSLGEWLSTRWLVLLSAIVLIAAIVLILRSSAAVLSVGPVDLGELGESGDHGATLARAFGQGAALPYFLDKNAFDATMSSLANALDTDEEVKSDDPRLLRLVPAVEAIREWSIFDRIQGPYRNFRRTFIISCIGIALAVCLAPLQLDSGSRVGEPKPVSVSLDVEGRELLREATGCSNPPKSTFLIVDGTWQAPVLAIDGPDCAFAATWAPRQGHYELRKLSAGG